MRVAPFSGAHLSFYLGIISEAGHHIAVGNMLRRGRTKLCLTTNFDNAIENAEPTWEKIVHTQGFSILNVPSKPTLLKLHGDVIQGNYIATLPKFINAEKLKEFSYIENLLDNKSILVAGYSGTGDIDIAPHLRNIKRGATKFIWITEPDREPPDIATHWFPSDLFSTDGEKNCLVRLAELDGSLLNIELKSPNWEERLNKWVHSISSTENVRHIIDESMDQVSGWAKFHIYFIDKWDKSKIRKNLLQEMDLIEFGRKCLEVGTYHSGLKALSAIDRKQIKKNDIALYHDLLEIIGFSNWRLARLNKAHNTLQYLINNPNANFEQKEKFLRIYLEVVRDILSSFNSQKEIIDFYNENKIKNTCTTLMSLTKETRNAANELLARLVILDIQRIIGNKTEVEKYLELYWKAIDLKIWHIARVTAQSILRTNLPEGIAKLQHLFDISGGAWKWHTIKHTILALIDILPKKYINFFRLTNIILSKIPVLLRELQLVIRKHYWWVAYKLSIIIES